MSDPRQFLIDAIVTCNDDPEYPGQIHVERWDGQTTIEYTTTFAAALDAPLGSGPAITLDVAYAAGMYHGLATLYGPDEVVEGNWSFTVAVLPTVSVYATQDASEDGARPAKFTIAQSHCNLESINLHYTLGGTATAGFDDEGLIGPEDADYLTPTEADEGEYSLALPAGEGPQLAEVELDTLNDSAVEDAETIELTLLADDVQPGGQPAYADPATNPASRPATAEAHVENLAVVSVKDPATAKKSAQEALQGLIDKFALDAPQQRDLATAAISKLLDAHREYEEYLLAQIGVNPDPPEIDARLRDVINRVLLLRAVLKEKDGKYILEFTNRKGTAPGIRHKVECIILDGGLAIEADHPWTEHPFKLDYASAVTAENDTYVADLRLVPKQTGTTRIKLTLSNQRLTELNTWVDADDGSFDRIYEVKMGK